MKDRQVKDKVDGQVYGQVSGRVWNQVYDQVRGQVRDQAWRNIPHMLENREDKLFLNNKQGEIEK